MTIEETKLPVERIEGHQLVTSSDMLANHLARTHPGFAASRLGNIIDAWTNRTFFYPDSTDLWLESDVLHVVMGLSKNEEFIELCLFATERSELLTLDQKRYILGTRAMEIIDLGSHYMADKTSCQISRDLYELLQKTARSLLVPVNQA